MDITLSFNPNSNFIDIGTNGADLQTGNDLANAIIISLFCNARAQSGDQYDGDDPQGWWGDSYATVQGFTVGSRLWLLRRQLLTQNIANLAQQYALEALQWLVTQFVVASVDVQTAIVDRFTLGMNITVTKPNGSIETFEYQFVWSQP